MKITKIQKEKIEQSRNNEFQRTLRLSRINSDKISFSAKVDSLTVDLFRHEINIFNEKNPSNKIRVGIVIEEILDNWTRDLRSLNREEAVKNRVQEGEL